MRRSTKRAILLTIHYPEKEPVKKVPTSTLDSNFRATLIKFTERLDWRWWYLIYCYTIYGKRSLPANYLAARTGRNSLIPSAALSPLIRPAVSTTYQGPKIVMSSLFVRHSLCEINTFVKYTILQPHSLITRARAGIMSMYRELLAGLKMPG